MGEIRITELDFDAIKNNLKNYLKSQSQFSDYNFEGSGLSVLLDVLAYNTHYNAMLAHLSTNEMFLDSAIKRSSVVSHAKTLGYIPRSAIASTIITDFVIQPGMITPPAAIAMDTTVAFTGKVNDTTFTFYPEKVYTAPFDPQTRKYTFSGVRLKEGTLAQARFVVQPDTKSGPFVLANQNIDISTLSINVRESADSITSESYKFSNTIIDVADDTKVFWIEESYDGLYRVLFGDGIIGKALSEGNIVTASYLVCAGDGRANGVRSLVQSSSINGFVNGTFENMGVSAGGAPPESVDSIRFNAPRFNATRNRAVTVQDYKSLLLANYPYIKGISVWGGEDNSPPIYGKVFVSIDPQDGYVVTQSEKDSIVSTILKPRSMLGMQHEFVDPDHLFIGLTVDVAYDVMRTRLSGSAIESLIKSEIQQYFYNEVSTLAETFRYSRLIRYIDASSPSIISSQVAVRLQRRLRIENGVETFINVNFITQIAKSSFRTSNFLTSVTGVSKRAYLKDNGEGKVSLFEVGSNLLLMRDVGEVDYTIGRVLLFSLLKTGDLTADTQLRFYATPAELAYDIAPAVVDRTKTVSSATYPYPAQNIVLKLDDSPQIVPSGVPMGLKVTAKIAKV
jgi:hypothetical protein